MKKIFHYSLNDIKSVANELIQIAGDNKTWAFIGDLGAGKTTLIKEIASALGSTDNVTSPTYTIVNQYNYPKGNIYHIDAYRIQDEEEAFNIGIEDILDSGDYVWIEWPKNIEYFLPKEFVSIQISINSKSRKLVLEII